MLTFCGLLRLGEYRFRRLLLAAGPLSASNETRAWAISKSWLLTSLKLLALDMTQLHNFFSLHCSDGLSLAACWLVVSTWFRLCVTVVFTVACCSSLLPV